MKQLMKAGGYARISGFLRIVVVLLASELGIGSLSAADRFVPYSGTVSGTIAVTLTPDGPVVASEAVQTVSHLGRGPQVFTQVDLRGFLDGFASPVVTVSEGFASNGDSVVILSTLWARPISADELTYEGTYRILGGTGRFGWNYPSFSADCGSGVITGAARVQITASGQFLFEFSNSFEGTIQAPLSRRR
ncbi:MAG: hypothetical protein J0L84_12050 [Verrucomicrobia bacterium]|nr:hypothetical protein [Verrucomicrobiota bacterium]